MKTKKSMNLCEHKWCKDSLKGDLIQVMEEGNSNKSIYKIKSYCKIKVKLSKLRTLIKKVIPRGDRE